ncbi:MAG: putative spermidine/putrescine transport system permease protein [Rhodospirillaceae bacterium]|jgi:putative spermidine/putrescine transport system permease protein|nr:putative spermidine/putrescine transport system permease protein [Rhodospirillaceae bacterium]
MMRPPSYATLGEKIVYYAAVALTALVLLFLISPILAIVPLSFNAEPYFSYPMPGLSLQWYRDFFGNARWTGAVILSLKLAVTVTILSTILGTMAALGLSRKDLPFRPVILGILILPMIVPVIITAVAAFIFYGYFGLIGTFSGLVLAHTVLATPFVVITVTSTLASFDWSLNRAAAGLGASPFYAFWKVILPLNLPGVISGALFAFVTSFDEVVVALFLSSPEQRTLPKQMFSGIREMISPTITAAATVQIVLSTLLLVGAELLRRNSERLRGIRS